MLRHQGFEDMASLFSLANYLPGNGHPQYDVSPDDQRFVMLRINDLAADTELILVENTIRPSRSSGSREWSRAGSVTST